MKRIDFWFMHVTSFAMLTFLLLVGCKEPMPTADSVDQSLVGSWTMDKEKTLLKQLESLQDQKILKSDEDVRAFKREFSTSYFTVELAQDATFQCSMGSSNERGVFSGYWNNDDDDISMVQTHEGAKEKRDTMKGRIVGDQLHMNHKIQGITVPYIFERVATAAEQDDELDL